MDVYVSRASARDLTKEQRRVGVQLQPISASLFSGNFFQICTCLAFFVAAAVVITVVAIRKFGGGNAICGDASTAFGGQEEWPTISDSVRGCEAETLVSALMPVYAFLRAMQIIGEFWTMLNRPSVALARIKPPGGRVAFDVPTDVNPKPDVAEYVSTQVEKAQRRVFPWACAVLVTSSLSQYFLILLLAVRSEVAMEPHKWFTFLFVLCYLAYAALDTGVRTINHDQPRRFSWWYFGRGVLLLLAAASGLAFGIAAFATNISSQDVAFAEYALAACILLHGLLAIPLLENLPSVVTTAPYVYVGATKPRNRVSVASDSRGSWQLLAAQYSAHERP